MIITAGGVATVAFHGTHAANKSAVQPANQSKLALAQGVTGLLNLSAVNAVQQAKNQSAVAGATNGTPAAAPTTKPAAAAPKYSTSSDPRSTTYSTTPPAPNPASFEIAITHAGQVAAGTAISYNATKNEKTYYGGDLILSTSTVTISKSSAIHTAPMTITIPDGAQAGMPSSPWNDHSPYAWIAIDSTQVKPSGSVWTMFVDINTTAPAGTYTLHIATGRVAQTTDGWEYDGFITVNIVP
ncbi:MAG: hypothetical protein ABWY71_00265 [Candidatus Saccharimonadales bacterium]